MRNLKIKGSDISALENDKLAAAASSIVSTFKEMRTGLIDDSGIAAAGLQVCG